MIILVKSLQVDITKIKWIQLLWRILSQSQFTLKLLMIMIINGCNNYFYQEVCNQQQKMKLH